MLLLGPSGELLIPDNYGAVLLADATKVGEHFDLLITDLCREAEDGG